MRYKNLLILVVILLMIPFASALASEVIVVPIDNTINPSETAVFELTVTNNGGSPQRYSIYSFQSGAGWVVDPYPVKDKILEIGPKQSYTTKIQAHTVDSLPPGIYNLIITIQSDSGETYDKSLKVYLAPEKPVDYLPSIKAEIDMDDKIDPKKPVSIKIFLENRNPLDLKNLQIELQSDMEEFVKEVAVDLPPMEQGTVEFTIIPNPFQQSKSYTLFFVFKNNGETFKVLEKKVEVISLLPEFKVDSEEETTFFNILNKVTITNDGNVLNTQIVYVPVSFIRSLFSTQGGTPKTINGQRYLAWEVTLDGGESTTVTYLTNYRILFYILLIGVIFLLFYALVRSPVVVNKKAVTTSSGGSGGLSEIKVTLDVRNRSKKPLKEIIVTDYVPGIAGVQETLELGTLKPREIKHLKKNTVVTWFLAELDSGEHRIITYKIRAKLHIVGTFSLPRASVEFKKSKRTKGKAYSNPFQLHSQQ